jgi:hypothetical protein
MAGTFIIDLQQRNIPPVLVYQLFQKLIGNEEHHHAPLIVSEPLGNMASLFYQSADTFLNVPSQVALMKNAPTPDHVGDKVLLAKKMFLATRLWTIVLCKQHSSACKLPGKGRKTPECFV